MSEITEVLLASQDFLNFKLSEKSIKIFEEYAEILVDWNKKINLTTITNFKDIAVKHFLDSIMVFKYIEIKEKFKIIDIGTGAGFPGIPIKILNEDILLTLLDSLKKRVIFLEFLTQKLQIKCNIFHSRAEELAKNKKYRGNFDIVMSRAVAPLNILSEYCLPFSKIGGIFIAMKGSNFEEEIRKSKLAINVLGGEIEKIEEFKLPDNSKRSLIIIRKILNTDNKYPRNSSKILKKSL